jgi:hypothetical protein
MKAQVKTKEQLIQEGWKDGVYKVPNRSYYVEGMYKGKSLNPEFQISTYEKRLLGQEVLIIDAVLENENPRFKVQMKDYETWLKWPMFVDDPGMDRSKFKNPKVDVITVGMGKIEIIENAIVNFDCGHRKMTVEKVYELMDVLKAHLPKRKKK